MAFKGRPYYAFSSVPFTLLLFRIEFLNLETAFKFIAVESINLTFLHTVIEYNIPETQEMVCIQL